MTKPATYCMGLPKILLGATLKYISEYLQPKHFMSMLFCGKMYTLN